MIEDLVTALTEMKCLGKVEAAVFGIAGPVDEAKGVVPVMIDIP